MYPKMKEIQRIHFVGIKGVGMTSLAIIAKEAGMSVTGSDLEEQFITDISLDQAGIVTYSGFSPIHLKDAQLVITTGAHNGFENIEVLSAKEKGIRVVSMAEAVGMVMSGELFGKKLKGISVAGTHGKTTTTALIATVLKENALDPSYFIGTSIIPSLGISGHFGKGDYFVVEADEYATEPKFDLRPKFFWHKPRIVIVTNIEHDHPDIYPTFRNFIEAFRNFLRSLPSDCVAVLNGDDPAIQQIIPEIRIRKITFGFNPGNDIVISGLNFTHNRSEFNLKAAGSDLGRFEIKVPGEHNCLNAVASIIASWETGLDTEQVKKGLASFIGSKRRLEYIGKIPSGAMLYDDYAHHPTEIRKTLNALKNLHPAKKIICIFQPHTYSRTKVLFDGFVKAFTDAETVIFIDIFPSAREAPDETVTSDKLANEAARFHKNSIFMSNPKDVVKYLIDTQPQENTIIVTMGAGDVYKIGQEILNTKT